MPFSGERLKRARMAKGMNQAELGKSVGVAYQQIGRWEQMQSLPSPDTLAQLAQTLECTADWLLELVDTPGDHLAERGLSEDEVQMLQLYRRGALPQLIQRLVVQLADGSTPRQTVSDETGQANIAS